MMGPVDASRIPDWYDRSHQGLVRWWQQMVSQHLAFHPDDDPGSVISFADGRPLFSAEGVAKLRAILDEMRREHGAAVYQVAEQEVLNWMVMQERASPAR
jgi:hypothetical protein